MTTTTADSNMCYNNGMSDATTVRKIGNSFGVILGKDLIAELNVDVGDALYIVRTPDGVLLTSYDPDFAEAMEAAREYMKRHRDAMRELAR